jgi:putative acetyltransferase
MTTYSIRPSTPEEAEAIIGIYPAIFPEEDLQPLVRDLLDEGEAVLSLGAVAEDEIIGHVVFTLCAVEGSTEHIGLLGPLGVLPDRQGQGIGRALVQAGFEAMKQRGIAKVCVLGDPDFYGRYGFEAEKDIKPPYDLLAEWGGAWQSVMLNDNAAPVTGTLTPPKPWQNKALWLP